MKRFITIIISCSLALAASAIAQQDDAQQPTPRKKHAAKANAPQDQAARPAPHPARGSQPRAHAKMHDNMPANAPANANAPAKANANAQAEPRNKAQQKRQHAAKYVDLQPQRVVRVVRHAIGARFDAGTAL